MEKKEKIMAILSQTYIEGLDFNKTVALYGGNPELYIRIIKKFVDSINLHLDLLAGLTGEGLEAYGIKVHGVKGSLYGIGANKEGDMARGLEIAAKAKDYEKLSLGNGPFIEAVNELAVKLRALLKELEDPACYGRKKAEPDKAVLASMLQASRDIDVEKMQELMKELEEFEYESGGDLVKWLSGQVTAFGYESIEERLREVI